MKIRVACSNFIVGHLQEINLNLVLQQRFRKLMVMRDGSQDSPAELQGRGMAGRIVGSIVYSSSEVGEPGRRLFRCSELMVVKAFTRMQKACKGSLFGGRGERFLAH